MRARCVICGEMWNVSIYQSIPKTGYICPVCTKKMCCFVGKQKQHTQNNLDLNAITEERKLKEEFNKEFEEWYKFFGYNPRLFEYLGNNVRMYAEQGK